tara:strand:+ start:228 stop:506 length:279 start_codon:yes stop_codon:yes gene_type:complete
MKYIGQVMANLAIVKQIEGFDIQRIIIKNWHNIMPISLAHRCSPEQIKGTNTLVVRVSSKEVLDKLKFSKKSFERKAKEFTNGVICKIEFSN